MLPSEDFRVSMRTMLGSPRRQLFVRFAAEAETATMYTPEALKNEITRAVGRASYHSISIAGRDPPAAIWSARYGPLLERFGLDSLSPADAMELLHDRVSWL